ncbi:hypothetical protein [Tahibacter amnicola]|uniref:Polyketide cyclase/dehydrase/lipid transport protein n=1 Tax=Tahibacter amnicola TaxID=2976241 RepID=A0ABY6BIK0_9GAMM|nr:hypothetical protein [Tahibacter amnicola]UXI69587.1 hypothetical protein N4264_08070 [Tahibacter amnicola]
MTRILEFIVAAVIVFVAAVVFGLTLPSHGYIERSIDVSHNIRHINDVLSNFRKFPEWGSLRLFDPKTQFTLEGPDFGVGAKLAFKSSEPSVGDGSYEVAEIEQDSKIVWTVNNRWKGENKKFTIRLEPAKSGRLTKIVWSFDVDYGMDLVARYSGLYLHGEPATQIQANLVSLQSQLAAIPNVDYTQTEIFIADVPAQPALVVATQAPRSLDEVAAATGKALEEIRAFMKKNNINAAGPYSIITTEWGEENYVFEVSQPIDKSELVLEGAPRPIVPAVVQPSATDDEAAPAELKPGMLDRKGNLVVTPTLRARQTYGGKALVTTWIGSPAGLPLMRLALKAYGMSRGYHFNDSINRYYDTMITDPATVADDEQQFKVYLPISDQVMANEPAAAPAAPAAEPAAAGG